MNLSVRDVAQLLKVSEKSIYRWVNQELIPAYRIHGQHRFNQAEVIEWATARRLQLEPAAFDEPETAASPLPCLFDALNAGGIIYRLDGDNRNRVLTSLVGNLRLQDGVDRDYLLKMLIAREDLASTGIGDGIAIPHPRNPVLLHTSQPTVALAFLEKPVDFGALDGRPVQILFSVISPSLRAHLHLLSMLGYALRDVGFRAAVTTMASREEILAALRQVKRGIGRDT